MERSSIVIFGASGDLTSRKLIPALYRLFIKKRLPPEFRIVGVSRSHFSDESWRDTLSTSTQQFVKKDFREETWKSFEKHVFYYSGDASQSDFFAPFDAFLTQMEKHAPTPRLYYLATAPTLYVPIVRGLAPYMQREKMVEIDGRPTPERRIVLEKPFGRDLKTARDLNAILHDNLDERQIFRIDHYLGKETAQNLMVFRFANAVFEPIWNRNYIENIQITANEETLVGKRYPYYNQSGVLRDMFQNHLFQLMTLVAMEPPVRFDADAVRDEKVKTLQAVRIYRTAEEVQENATFGRYSNPEEETLSPNVATFAAVRFFIDNWRWQGVPFFLRSGKGMSCRTTQIVIQFRRPPHLMFSKGVFQPNRLLIQIQPAEGIQLYFQSKIPDTNMEIGQAELHFNFLRSFQKEMPDGYERLILDAIHGDASLFARSDEVESAWQIIDAILSKRQDALPYPYEIGGWGPEESQIWMQNLGATWFNSCPVL
ncbi:MAG: glucose-6-phosphate dehydrogenase [Planctomycetia bacterium]|nr:glucose-6-phosphate dehydrogenase [Planctomycetia bacterium]